MGRGLLAACPAVRWSWRWRGCLGFPFWLAVLAECHLDGAFVGAAQDGQLDGLGGCLERAGQVVDRADWLAAGRHDQVTGCQASARGRAVLGDVADEQAVGCSRLTDSPRASASTRPRSASSAGMAR